jgi:hypothetical protein
MGRRMDCLVCGAQYWSAVAAQIVDEQVCDACGGPLVLGPQAGEGRPQRPAKADLDPLPGLEWLVDPDAAPYGES